MSTAAQDEARMLAAQESNADAEAAVAAMARAKGEAHWVPIIPCDAGQGLSSTTFR